MWWYVLTQWHWQFHHFSSIHSMFDTMLNLSMDNEPLHTHPSLAYYKAPRSTGRRVVGWSRCWQPTWCVFVPFFADNYAGRICFTLVQAVPEYLLPSRSYYRSSSSTYQWKCPLGPICSASHLEIYAAYWGGTYQSYPMTFYEANCP